MSPDDHAAAWRAAGVAIDAIASAGGDGGEVLLRRSRGTSLRVARGTPPESSAWDEEGIAVLASAEGRGALATGPAWCAAGEVARRAVELARADGRAIEPPPHRLRERARVGDVGLDPPGLAALEEALATIERSALATDERVVALDAARARAAVVSSYLVTPEGVAVHQRHATALAHASVLVRDGMRAATRAEAWASPQLSDVECRAFGVRTARSAVVNLTGSGAAPPQPKRVLLGPAALAEITFGLGLALLGALPIDGADSIAADPRLQLVEDAADDSTARAMGTDGTGRPLRRIVVVGHGAWRRPHPSELPWVRPGLGDRPRPGWMRLTWSWRGGEDEEALVQRMRQGLQVETAHPASMAVRAGRWTGSVSGWWVEDGRRRHAVAGVPLTLTMDQIIRGAVAGGDARFHAHPSGTVVAPSLVIDLER